MFNKIQKFEHFLNKLIERIKALLLRLISFILPPFAKKFGIKLKESIRKLLLKMVELSKKLKFLPAYVSKTMTGLQRTLNASANRGLKDKFLDVTIRTSIKQHFLNFKDLLKKIHLFFINKFFQDPKYAIRTLAVCFIIFGTYTIFNSTTDIYNQENPNRQPASITPNKVKPDYAKFKKRTLKVLNIQVPVSYTNVNDIHSVNVNFTIRTSSRFARMYLENYEYKLKDHFFSTVEPVISSFAIQNEGKDVLEEKIRYELQSFLDKNRVEGKVLEVNTISILAN